MPAWKRPDPARTMADTLEMAERRQRPAFASWWTRWRWAAADFFMNFWSVEVWRTKHRWHWRRLAGWLGHFLGGDR